MFNNVKMVAALVGYCAIVLLLLALMPWVNWSRYGNIWVINLSILPVLPCALFLISQRWPLRVPPALRTIRNR